MADLFADVFSPTAAELEIWAAGDKNRSPVQDFELMIQLSDDEVAKVVLRLAADGRCPKQTFFAGVLNLALHDAARTSFSTLSAARFRELLRGVRELPDHRLLADWVSRVEAAIAAPISAATAAKKAHSMR